MPGAAAPGPLEGRARLALGTLIHEIGEYRTARAHLARSLRTWRARGDEDRTATTLDALAWVETQLGAYDAAVRLSTEAAALHARRDDAAGRATSCTNLGWVAQYRGRPHRARTWHERSLALRRALGDRRGAAYARINLSWALLALGEVDAADAEVSAALALLAPLGDRQLTAWARTMQGRIARDRGAVELARTRFARSVPLWRDVGNLHGVVISLSELAWLLVDVGDHDEALRRLGEAEAANATVGNPWLGAQQRLTRARLRWQRGERSAALRDAECAYRMRLMLRDRRGAAVARRLWARWREVLPPRTSER